MRAHHQAGLARGDLLQHGRSCLALAAAGEPGHGDAQRLQPLHQLVEVLLGQDLGGRHERALPAGVDGARGGQRGHHRLARAHVALQQAVHGHGLGQIGVDLGTHPRLGGGERKGQGGEQAAVQLPVRRGQRRCAQPLPRGQGLRLGQLLRQQFVKLQALPGRMAAVFQGGQGQPGWGLVQQAHSLLQVGQAGGHRARWQHFVQGHARQGRTDGFAQVHLRQLRAAGVNGRQRQGQRRTGLHRLEHRVHHLPPQKAATHLTAHAHALAAGQHLLVRGVEVQKTQRDLAAVVGQAHHQLAPAAQLHLRLAHHAFHLRRVAVSRLADGSDARLVLVAQRQVQRQVDVAHQAQTLHCLLGCGLDTWCVGHGAHCRPPAWAVASPEISIT